MFRQRTIFQNDIRCRKAFQRLGHTLNNLQPIEHKESRDGLFMFICTDEDRIDTMVERGVFAVPLNLGREGYRIRDMSGSKKGKQRSQKVKPPQ